MQYVYAMMPLSAQQFAVDIVYIAVFHDGAAVLNLHSRQEERGG